MSIKLLAYIKARLAEKSTWSAISVGLVGAAALSPPWSFAFVAVAVIGAIVPTTTPDA
jgi:hypothetical protein